MTEALCWAHSRRKFFELADLAASARGKAQGKTDVVISPMALEAVQRIDRLFDIERAINGLTAEQRLVARQDLSKPLVADKEEIRINPRARSAKLRAAERTAAPPWPKTLDMGEAA